MTVAKQNMICIALEISLGNNTTTKAPMNSTLITMATAKKNTTETETTHLPIYTSSSQTPAGTI